MINLPQLKNNIKAIPVFGIFSVRVWRFLKSHCWQIAGRGYLPPSFGGTKDYSKLGMAEIKQELDKRFSNGKSAYGRPTLWDEVRAVELDRLCVEMTSPMDGKKILEIGCGVASFVPYITACDEYIGTDLSSEAINTAAHEFGNKPGFSFQVMDAQDLKFSDCTFDLVLAREVIEHVPDIKSTLSEAYRVLKPGGCILVTSPNRNSLHLRINRLLGYKDFTCAFDHIKELTFEEAEQMLLETGFQIIDTNGIFLQPYWGVQGLDEHVRHFTDNDPDTVSMLRDLGRLCGAKYAFGYLIKAQKPF